MRILIVGGTRFVGRHIASAAIAAGDDVSLLHRGRTGADMFGDDVRHLSCDRNDPDALAAVLGEGEWDATIDVCAYFPHQVTMLADALNGRGGWFGFVSTVSVYDPEGPGFTEDSRLLEFDGPTPTDLTDTSYGGLKVLCERTAIERFGRANTLVVRPTYVVGPADHHGFLDYWAHRIARGGEILAPGHPGAPVQVIDARDLAAFVHSGLSSGRSGTFHLVGASASYTFGDLFRDVAVGVGVEEVNLTWVPDAYLLESGVTSSDLPMWSQGDPAEDLSNAADPSASMSAGARIRPVAESARDVLATGRPTSQALSAAREAEILAAWHASG